MTRYRQIVCPVDQNAVSDLNILQLNRRCILQILFAGSNADEFAIAGCTRDAEGRTGIGRQRDDRPIDRLDRRRYACSLRLGFLGCGAEWQSVARENHTGRGCGAKCNGQKAVCGCGFITSINLHRRSPAKRGYLQSFTSR